MNSSQHFVLCSVLKPFALAALLGTGLCGSTQESSPNRVVAPLADPSRPAIVKAHLLNGSITVKGSEVKEVIVEIHGGGHEISAPESSRGLRRIDRPMSVDTENNEVNIKPDIFHQGDCTITVPHRSSLFLSTVNGSNITVSDVEGELEVKNINGGVTLNRVGGSVVAHALNGRLVATFTRVDPEKPMAFSSMNGDIDVTLPASVKANLTMRTDNGAVYSDFDLQPQPSSQTLEENGGKQGKYRLRTDKTLHATLNGGGPEIQVKDFNGNIYLRKAGSK